MKVSIRVNGDGTFTLLQGNNWLANIRINGELTVDQQVHLTDALAREAERQMDLVNAQVSQGKVDRHDPSCMGAFLRHKP